MARAAVPNRAFRFGAFEFDGRSGELRKHGIKIKLQDQPSQILILLLERAGEIVSREEIRAKLWPENTFVDFDNAISSAIRKLRESLADFPDNPRFIETLSRRGYRFIAPVEAMHAAAPEHSPDTRRVDFKSPAVQDQMSHPKGERRGATMLALAIILGASLLAAVILRSRRFETNEGSTLHRLTSDPGLTTDPAVSRDGTLLAYASDRSGEGHLGIWIQQLNGGAAIRLTHYDADDRAPSFSADSTQVVFRSEREQGGIYVVPSLGGEARLIMPKGRDPRFSPDGKWIAYWVRPGKVYVVPAAGGKPREVSQGLALASAPVWSPDCRFLLVYGVQKIEPHYQDNADWWVLPLNGGAPARTGAYATFQRQGLELDSLDLVPASALAQWVGNQIFFSAKLGDGVDLWRTKISAGDWRVNERAERLTSIAGQAVSASIVADHRIVFANLSSQTHLWSLRLDPDRGTAAGIPKQLT